MNICLSNSCQRTYDYLDATVKLLVLRYPLQVIVLKQNHLFTGIDGVYYSYNLLFHLPKKLQLLETSG